MSEIAKIPNNLPSTKDISNNLGIESFLSSRSSGRRYSAVPNFDAISLGQRKKSTSNFLETLGTGVVSQVCHWIAFQFLSSLFELQQQLFGK